MTDSGAKVARGMMAVVTVLEQAEQVCRDWAGPA